MDTAIKLQDILSSIRQFQLAVDQANVRLNFVIAPGAWLMPSRMILNSDSEIGYNNALRQGGPEMKIVVNNDVNSPPKKRPLTRWMGVIQRSTSRTTILPIQSTKPQRLNPATRQPAKTRSNGLTSQPKPRSLLKTKRSIKQLGLALASAGLFYWVTRLSRLLM